MMRTSYTYICLLILVAVGPSNAFSQNRISLLEQMIQKAYNKIGGAVSPTALRAPVSELGVDLSTPVAPAFVVLGVTPESVIRPTSPKQFATSMLQGTDPAGNLQAGIAIQTSPYLLFGGNELTIQRYRDNYQERLLSRTELSFATTKGEADDESVRMAVGLTITPWDRGDPRARPAPGEIDLAVCIAAALTPINAAIGQIRVKYSRHMIDLSLPMPTQDEIDKAVAELVTQQMKGAVVSCRNEFRKENWNASAWNVGVAPTWLSPTGQFDDMQWAGAAIYSTLSYGFEGFELLKDNSQLLLHARYRMDEQATTSDMPTLFFEQDTLTLSGQLRIAGPTISDRDIVGGPDLNFLAEVMYAREDRSGRPSEDVFRYILGAEYRLTEDVYLKITAGTEDGREQSSDQSFAMFNLKWNLSERPKIGN